MKKLLIASVVAAGVATAGAASAAMAPAPMMTGVTAPWHVGVGLNYASNLTSKVTHPTTSPSLKLNNRGLGGNVFVGYRVNKYFGTELGVDILGDNKYKSTDTNGTTNSSYVKLTDQWNVNFVGQAFLPVTSWFSPYAFAGVAYINSEMKQPGNITTDRDGFGLLYGAGLQFNFNQFGIRASYTRQDLNTDYTTIAGLEIPQTKDYISLDVLYRFGA